LREYKDRHVAGIATHSIRIYNLPIGSYLSAANGGPHIHKNSLFSYY